MPSVKKLRAIAAALGMTVREIFEAEVDTKTVEFGKRLAQVRQSHGWTQTETAKMLGICAASVSSYERGVFLPSREKQMKMIGKLGLTVEVFYGDDGRGEKSV